MNNDYTRFSFAASIVLLLILPGVAFSSTEHSRHGRSLSSFTSNIDSKRAAIDRRLRMYRASEKPYPYETDRGGSLTAYTEGRRVRKIVLDIMVSRQDHIITFYYFGNRLLTAAVTERSYIWEGGEEGDINFTKFHDTHMFIYFQNGKRVCWRWAGQKKLHVDQIMYYNNDLEETSRTCLAAVFPNKKVNPLSKAK